MCNSCQNSSEATGDCTCSDNEKRNQNISSMCLVCGKDNPFSLHAQFVEDRKTNEVICYFTPQDVHQSYPDRVHGGIAAAVLDEVIGRAVQLAHPGVWGVTIALNLKYRRPVPYGGKLVCRGRCTKLSHRTFEGAGEILDHKGRVAVSATGTYAICPPEAMTGDGNLDDMWFVDDRPVEQE